jgi:molybdopterin-guanine dinucleotide biosynthesis protein B
MTSSVTPIKPAILGFVAYSGTGKTTLIEKLITYLTKLGYKISVIKHTHHRFDVDRPGKDSYRHREAGAGEVLLVSDQRWVLMHEQETIQEMSIEEQLSKLAPCDLVFLEGFKASPIPKIELWRADHEECANNPLKAHVDPYILAVAYPGGSGAINQPVLNKELTILDLDNLEQMAHFILATSGIQKK